MLKIRTKLCNFSIPYEFSVPLIVFARYDLRVYYFTDSKPLYNSKLAPFKPNPFKYTLKSGHLNLKHSL
jgi:hypothetical protein